MAHARISMYMPPDIDPTKAAIAYGCRALPKLNEELQSQDLLTRQKALVALCDLMHDPEYVYEAINIGCLESLKALLKDDDNLVRIKTTEVLYIMATHNVGRVGFLENDVIIALSLLLNDHQSVCRENLHQAYKHLAQLPAEEYQKEADLLGKPVSSLCAHCFCQDSSSALTGYLDGLAVPRTFAPFLAAYDHLNRTKESHFLAEDPVPVPGKHQASCCCAEEQAQLCHPKNKEPSVRGKSSVGELAFFQAMGTAGRTWSGPVVQPLPWQSNVNPHAEAKGDKMAWE
ncbi:radial spoke head 14-like [Sigmodon hispidus]